MANKGYALTDSSSQLLSTNMAGISQIWATVGSINAMSVAATKVYTVALPAGKTFFRCVRILLRCTALTGTIVNPDGMGVFTIGSNAASYNNLSASCPLLRYTATGLEIYAQEAGNNDGYALLGDAAEIYVNITTAVSTGGGGTVTVCTISADVEGYYF